MEGGGVMTSGTQTGRPSPCGTSQQPSQTSGMAPTLCSPQPWQAIGGRRELSPAGHVNCGPSGHTALVHHEATTAEAPAVHITTMAAQGRRCATLRGVVSSVRMAEQLELVPPTVRPLHWLLCEAADRLYCPRPPRWLWATKDTFRTIADGGLAGDVLTAVATLVAAHCWRVSEVASIGPVKVRNKYIMARTGLRGEAWRRRLHAQVAHRPAFLLVFANRDALQDALRRRLLGTPWDFMAWHGVRRCAAAAMAVAGAHMRAIGIWGRWRSERQAAKYGGVPLDWVRGAPSTLPWLEAGGGVQYKATGVMDMWPIGTIFGMADSTTPKRGERSGSKRKPEPDIISDSAQSMSRGYWGPLQHVCEYSAPSPEHDQSPSPNWHEVQLR